MSPWLEWRETTETGSTITYLLRDGRMDERRTRHYRTHPSCYYRPSCVRCWIGAFYALLRLRISG